MKMNKEKIAILISKRDEAGMNIAEELKKEKIPFNLLEKESIFEENIDIKISGNFYVFATKHQSTQHNKTLTIHAPGNWNKADFGGKNNEVCPTSAFFLKHLFKILNEEKEKAKSQFQVSLEATHHGPLINKPCCFIEIGSSKEEWKDKEAGKIIAKTISRILKEKIPQAIPALAIGGPHYCPNFNKLQLNSEYAIGHVIPEYALKNFNESMLLEALKKTEEKVEAAILDWKGCGKSEERQKIINILKKNNLKILRTDQL